jgi:hypothetical protein
MYLPFALIFISTKTAEMPTRGISETWSCSFLFDSRATLSLGSPFHNSPSSSSTQIQAEETKQIGLRAL